MTERAIEYILQHEPDEQKAQKAIDRFLKLKEEVDEYITENYEEDK